MSDFHPRPVNLRPLAWVLGEVKLSLEMAQEALGHHLALLSAGEDASTSSAMRDARHHLHGCAGALDMVGMPAAARVLRAAEAAVQRLPTVGVDAVAVVEGLRRGGHAVIEYLQRQMAGAQPSDLLLFPAYRSLCEHAGVERIHPADLWFQRWQWQAVTVDVQSQPRRVDAYARALVEEQVLSLMREPQGTAAATMSDLFADFGAAETDPRLQALWHVAAAFFEALAQRLLQPSLYAKRAASRLLAQLRLSAKRDAQPSTDATLASDALAHDLLYFCAQAGRTGNQPKTPRLAAVRLAFGLQDCVGIDVETPRLGRVDPAALAQALVRVGRAKQAWSALVGEDPGDTSDTPAVLGEAGASLTALVPRGAALAKTWTDAAEAAESTGTRPAATLAMEVATSLLFVEASWAGAEFDAPEGADRIEHLATRVRAALAGQEPPPAPSWIDELYRRVADRQTLVALVGELRTNLGEVEKLIDQAVRHPNQPDPLGDVSGLLDGLRGAFGMLRIDAARLTVTRIAQDLPSVRERTETAALQRLADNVGALGFLIDTLEVQPTAIHEAWRFDDARGCLTAVTDGDDVNTDRAGLPAALRDRVERLARAAVGAALPDEVLATMERLAQDATVADQGELLQVLNAALAALRAGGGDDDRVGATRLDLAHALHGLLAVEATALPASEELSLLPAATLQASAAAPDSSLRAIFLEEAREALQAAGESLVRLAGRTTGLDEWAELTALRRTFHTLKGSSRMVGLSAFGDTAWAGEQVFNRRLAAHQQADTALLDFTAEALDALGRWIGAIANEGAPSDEYAQALAHAVHQLQAHEIDVPMADVVTDATVGALVAAVAPLTDGSKSETDTAASGITSSDAALPADLTIAGQRLPLDLPLATDLEFDLALPAIDARLESTSAAASSDALPDDEAAGTSDAEQFKHVGPLRISIALFNVFLNEADEHARRLATEVAEWSLELHRPVAGAAVAMAHSLAGNASAVDFDALSRLAREFEAALQRSHDQGHGDPAEAQLFNDVADEIRRLLHQFAAGFLRDASADLWQGLARHAARAQSDATDARGQGPDDEAAQPAEPESGPESEPAPEPALVDDADATLDAEPDVAAPALPDDLAVESNGAGTAGVEDAVDAQLFAIFEDEGPELLQALAAQVRRWATEPAQAAHAGACMRTLHTLKGGARLAGAMRLGDMAHRLEAEIEAALARGGAQGDDLDEWQGRVDAMRVAYDALDANGAQPSAPELASLPAAPGVQVVRVRVPLLDRLVNHAGELSLSRARIETDVGRWRSALDNLGESVDRLRAQMRDLEWQAESQVTAQQDSAREHSGSFDVLEFDRFTRVQELTRMMAEAVNDVVTVQRNLQAGLRSTEDELAGQARLARELHEDLLRTRMVEFEALSDRLYRVVRQTAKETGKQVRLDIVGGGIEVDRGVLDRMAGAFEHLLRNAVGHGIETPATRAQAGKDPSGQITVTLTQEGNEVGVEFRDDGAGLDLARIRERALANGLAAATGSDADLVALIFSPGFSTAAQLSELAGRGVGLDVVRAEVNALGGRIETHSQPGQGTRFRLLLPLTTAVTQVVRLRCGEREVAVPSTLVETVRRVAPADIAQAYGDGRLNLDGEPVPFYWMGSLLDFNPISVDRERAPMVVVARSAQQRVALHVDEVIGNQEVVVKALGAQLSRLPGLAGMTLLPDGTPTLIYNPVALAALYGPGAAQASLEALTAPAGSAGAMAAAALPPLILVVDDSLTVRRVTQRLLSGQGWRVSLAKDGVQALERLEEEIPSAVLTDLEMPRMDGFDLVRRLRGDPRWQTLPVVVITSRIAQKHRDLAQELGVAHYLGKPYDEQALVELVGSLIAAG